MKHRSLVVALALFAAAQLILLPARANDIPGKDVPGSHDNPIISRFAGSVIAGYQQLDYDQAVLPLGKANWKKPHGFDKVETVEGKITRIFYLAPRGKTGLEVFRNFQHALSAAHFKTRFACAGDSGPHSCHGMDFVDKAVTQSMRDAMHANNLMVFSLNSVSGNVRALTAHLDRPQGNVDVSLLVSQTERYPVGILLQIVEGKSMASGEVKVNAKAISKGLAQNGHIALYGIHFASDSATLKPSSDDTLVQMAKMLKQHPAMKVYIVGHTDDTGTLSHNLVLSQQRAQAVDDALIQRYHIKGSRLAAKGVASYAPVASNADAAGRALNRRVEMVVQ
jgi:OOP family OmpA-OmpF porin